MKAAGSHSRLRRSYSEYSIVLAIFLCVVIGAVVLTVRARASQQLKSVRRSEAWIQSAFSELQNTPPPTLGPEFGKDYLPAWISEKYLLFTNGWAAYKYHSFHEEDGLGDLTLLRLSDDRFFISKRHFCQRLDGEMSRTDTNSPAQPADADEFLKLQGTNLELTEFSVDKNLKCAAICLESSNFSRSKRSLWVWISDGTQKTLLEHDYRVEGSYVTWNTHWVSTNEVEIDVIDWGSFGAPDNHDQIRPITKLSFHRDKQTRLFAGPE